MGRGRIHGLDALRGVAALIVVAFHMDRSLIEQGGAAVDLFFVLSGFVLARTYDGRLATDLSVGQFLKKRFFRLWPVYAFGCTIGLLVALERGFDLSMVGPIFVVSLLFLPYPSLAVHPYFLNLPGWSLTYELIGNILHAWLFARMDNRQLVTRYLIYTVLLFGFMILRGGENDGFWFAEAFFRMLVSYTAGVLVFRNHHLFPKPPAWAAVLSLPILILAAGHLPDPYGRLGFVFVCCPLLVASAAAGNFPFPRAAAFVGAMSYPLYAVHLPILDGVAINGGTRTEGALIALCVASLVVFLGAAVQKLGSVTLWETRPWAR